MVAGIHGAGATLGIGETQTTKSIIKFWTLDLQESPMDT